MHLLDFYEHTALQMHYYLNAWEITGPPSKQFRYQNCIAIPIILTLLVHILIQALLNVML